MRSHVSTQSIVVEQHIREGNIANLLHILKALKLGLTGKSVAFRCTFDHDLSTIFFPKWPLFIQSLSVKADHNSKEFQYEISISTSPITKIPGVPKCYTRITDGIYSPIFTVRKQSCRKNVCQESCPQRDVYSSMHWGRHPHPRAGTPTEVHPQQVQTPWAGTPPGQVHPPAQVNPGRYSPPLPTDTAADGTHPTGMISCFSLLSCKFSGYA